ncbi:MAG TPA: phosphatase PAP2 family protein [Dongiaceae bacterium]|nr:phosphatase PAP2 family protein [Dongiaceae bacterium]
MLVLFGIITLATFGLATAFSYGVLHWGDVLSVYLQIGLLGVAAGIVPAIVLRTFDARRIGKSPLKEVLSGLSDLRLWAWLAVPGFIAPIFMASFTIAKTLIGIKLGFTWDAFFADLDRLLFGTDPWRYTHAIFGTTAGSEFLEFFYVGWGAPMAFSMPLVIVMARREHAAKFLLAMFLTWAVAGLCLAALFSSAGPCFAHIFDPAVAERFAPLNDRLALLLGNDDAIRLTQMYLAKYWNAKVAVKGGGISAFPSVHVGVAFLYVVASWRTPLLRHGSMVFASFIWIGSIHFGYHYAVDGIASAGIAFGCWMAAGRIVALIAARHQPRSALA